MPRRSRSRPVSLHRDDEATLTATPPLSTRCASDNVLSTAMAGPTPCLTLVLTACSRSACVQMTAASVPVTAQPAVMSYNQSIA